MKYLYLILIIGLISCSSNSNSNEAKEDNTAVYNWDTTALSEDQKELDTALFYKVTITEPNINCKTAALFKENLTLPLKIDNDFFTMFDNVGEKIAIPYECVNNAEIEYHQGSPINIYYAYGKAELDDGKDYYLVIEAVNPDNPVDLFYVSAVLFSNVSGKLDNGIEIAKYHAYSGVREYYDGTLNKDGTINQQIKKIGNDGISESVFEERDTSFSIKM